MQMRCAVREILLVAAMAALFAAAGCSSSGDAGSVQGTTAHDGGAGTDGATPADSDAGGPGPSGGGSGGDAASGALDGGGGGPGPGSGGAADGGTGAGGGADAGTGGGTGGSGGGDAGTGNPGSAACESSGKSAYATYGTSVFVNINEAIFAGEAAESSAHGTTNLGDSFSKVGSGNPPSTADDLDTFKGKLAAFLVYVYGGPAQIQYGRAPNLRNYTGPQDMVAAHTGLGITDAQYQYFLANIVVPALVSSGVKNGTGGSSDPNDVSSCFAPALVDKSFEATIIGH